MDSREQVAEADGEQRLAEAAFEATRPEPVRTTVAAVVVSYNVRDMLVDCVGDLVAARDAGEIDEVVVVDNRSTDGSYDAIQSRFPEVKLLLGPGRGYGSGANVGLEQVASDYVIVLNSDTRVSAGTISALREFLDNYPGVGIVSPRLRLPSGEIQVARHRFPTRLTPLFVSTTIAQWWPNNPVRRRFLYVNREEDRVQLVDWVAGAFLMMRREPLQALGGFDEAYYMYCEEVDLAWRFRRAGSRTAYVPSVEVVHIGGASTYNSWISRRIEYDTSRVLLQRRLHGPLNAWLIRVVFLAGYLFTIGRNGFRWLRNDDRPERSERMRFYWRALRSGLRAPRFEDS